MTRSRGELTRPEFRVGVYPAEAVGNPYLPLFHASLKPHQVTWRPLVVNDAWLREHARELDAVHIHWPEEIWRLRGAGAAHRLRGVAGLRRFLALAGRLGLKRIWTLHNLEHHEGSDWIDRIGYRVLAHGADLIICHSQWAAAMARRRHRIRGDVTVMPIGAYHAAYPAPRDARAVAEALGLDPRKPILSVVGTMRGYKGIDTALRAAALLGDRIQLVIAGEPHESFDPATLCPRPGRDVVIPRRLSDQEFADIVAASAAVLLPYRRITGSAALMAAWTLGKGVIASDLPYFREMLDADADAGRLFPASDAGALAAAIGEYLDVPEPRRQAAATRRADRFAWSHTITPVVDVFNRWREAPLPC